MRLHEFPCNHDGLTGILETKVERENETEARIKSGSNLEISSVQVTRTGVVALGNEPCLGGEAQALSSCPPASRQSALH